MVVGTFSIPFHEPCIQWKTRLACSHFPPCLGVLWPQELWPGELGLRLKEIWLAAGPQFHASNLYFTTDHTKFQDVRHAIRLSIICFSNVHFVPTTFNCQLVCTAISRDYNSLLTSFLPCSNLRTLSRLRPEFLTEFLRECYFQLCMQHYFSTVFSKLNDLHLPSMYFLSGSDSPKARD